MLSVDEGSDSALLLNVSNCVKCEGGLTRGLRTVDFYDAATGKSANAERNIQCDGAGRNHLDGSALVASQAHDGTLTKLAVDLG